MGLCDAIFWLALNLYHESRGQPDHIQIAVAHVTINRAANKKQSIKTTVNERSQFSWTLDRRKVKSKPWITDPETFLVCSLNAVRATIKPDTTKQSVFYHESRMTPRWAKKMKLTKKIGPFKFYKERKI